MAATEIPTHESGKRVVRRVRGLRLHARARHTVAGKPPHRRSASYGSPLTAPTGAEKSMALGTGHSRLTRA